MYLFSIMNIVIASNFLQYLADWTLLKFVIFFEAPYWIAQPPKNLANYATGDQLVSDVRQIWNFDPGTKPNPKSTL